MPDKLTAYRGKRDRRRTPEPVPPEGPLPTGADDTFVIQEHHARRLHWDFRLERDGVLVSWALPKGVPDDPARNHLAVHTEDHPLDYAAFAGEIPKGEYGGGQVTIWDRGTYTCEKWTDREVKVVLRGSRVTGRFALFRTRGDDWMIHRMDAPADEAAEPMPDTIRPMLATTGELPAGDEQRRWAFEMKWDGVRAVVYVDRGTVRVLTRNDREVAATYPELRGLAEALGARRVVLDGEIVAFDDTGRPSFGTLQQRMHVQRPSASLRAQVPVTFLAFDVLYLDGESLLGRTYDERRAVLESLGLDGPHWATPPAFEGDGEAARRASREQGLEGVLAKRRDSAYEPGRRSRSWVKVKHFLTQEVVIGGWKPGEGRRSGGIGSLLLGVHDAETGELRYAGHVGTGFTVRMLDDLERRLARMGRKTPPFTDEVPRAQARDARWVTPALVGEVAFAEWTRDGRLRHPSWQGLRPDKSAGEVV
ncbi:MAG TPA: non-homologous end-joining DNA ligase, partial [Candidatus Eisenbacteria bacterium]|nr:non-homologous end-joining DNA ligase [Candidatus Eisenbacteria bacterium]